MKIVAITLYPFIIATKEARKNKIIMNHEKIHLSQQKELLVIFFYILYLGNMLWLLVRWRDIHKAYMLNIFEVEAYTYGGDLTYLRRRKLFWSFKKTGETKRYIKNIIDLESKKSDVVKAWAILLGILADVIGFILLGIFI